MLGHIRKGSRWRPRLAFRCPWEPGFRSSGTPWCGAGGRRLDEGVFVHIITKRTGSNCSRHDLRRYGYEHCGQCQRRAEPCDFHPPFARAAPIIPHHFPPSRPGQNAFARSSAELQVSPSHGFELPLMLPRCRRSCQACLGASNVQVPVIALRKGGCAKEFAVRGRKPPSCAGSLFPRL